MFKTFRPLKRVSCLPRFGSSTSPARGLATRDLSRFDEGDRFIIDGTKISKPLIRGERTEVPWGHIFHDDIIGQNVSAAFFYRTQKGKLYKIEQTSFDQYIALTPRLVTPVYASYASMILSLLDIQPTPYSEITESPRGTLPTLEILEAGTGHGALTLHLAQAISSANAPLLSTKVPARRSGKTSKEIDVEEQETREQMKEAWSIWKESRRAVLHTVDNVVANRWHAEKLVRQFRQGLYWPHVDFHHADVCQWVGEKMAERQGEAFLSHVFLDMPSVHHKLKDIHPATRDGAKVVVFVPSITQICDCVKLVQDARMPLTLMKVVELGEGISSGRKWDVRAVKPRKPSISEQPAKTVSVPIDPGDDVDVANEGDKPTSDVPVLEASAEDGPSSALPGASEREVSEPIAGDNGAESTTTEIPSVETSPGHVQETVMICRPQIGERTMGGGFVAIFSKVSPEYAQLEREWKRTQTGSRKRLYR